MAVTDTDADLDVTPLSGNIGAVIRGVDLRDVDDITVAAIRRVWLDRKVVFFPGQHLDPDSHQAFASHFGVLTEGHPVIPGVAGSPNIFEIDYSQAREVFANYGDVATRRQGLDWHTDVTFVKRPPLTWPGCRSGAWRGGSPPSPKDGCRSAARSSCLGSPR